MLTAQAAGLTEPLFPSYLKRYFRRNDSKRFDVKTVLGRPTSFVTDEQLMQQLDPPDQWQHVASGGFGNVFLARWLSVDVVVKWCEKPEVEDDEFLNFEEALMTSSLRHPHTVTFFVASPSAIVLERMGGGSLSTKIRTCTGATQTQRLLWCWQIVSAMRYIHTFDVIHGDVAIDNIMFTTEGVAKLGDFGAAYFSAVHSSAERITTDKYLPLALQSPNADIQTAIGLDTDRYALACVLLNLLSWNADIYELCGLSFFERTLMSSADRDAYITQCLGIACERVWQALGCFALLSVRSKCILFHFFTHPCLDMMDPSTVSFVRDKLSCLQCTGMQALTMLQDSLAEDLEKSSALSATTDGSSSPVECTMASAL